MSALFRQSFSGRDVWRGNKKAAPEKEAAPVFRLQPALTLHEEQEGDQSEERAENTDGPGHVAEEAGHLDALFFGDGLHHEVRRVADVGVGAHEHGTGGNGGQHFAVGHELGSVAAGGVEEHEVGGSVVQEGGQQTGHPEEHGGHVMTFIKLCGG